MSPRLHPALAFAGTLALAIAGCAASSPASATLSPSPVSAATSSTGVSIAATACAGVGVSRLQIHIASGGTTTGDVLDPSSGDSVTGTYALSWPPGYAVVTSGSRREVRTDGAVVVADGGILVNLQVCKSAGTLAITDPGSPASAAP